MRSTDAGLLPALAALLLTPAATAGIVVDAGADAPFHARTQQALVVIANSPVAAIRTLYRAADTAVVTITIRPLTDDPATWNEDREPERSHTEPADGLPREAARTAPTGAIIFLNPDAVDPDRRRWAGGTLIHELVHASDLAQGRYHPEYEIRERRAVLFQNLWRAQMGYKLREDYHGRVETRDYQKALERGRLDALVQYVFSHADLPAKPGLLDEVRDEIANLAWRDIAEAALGTGLGALALWILWHALKNRHAGNAVALHPELRLRIIGAAIGGIALCVASLICVGLAFATADLRDPKLDAVLYGVLFAGTGLATAWLAYALPVPRIAHYRRLGWVLRSQPARPVTAIIEGVMTCKGWPVAIAVRVEKGLDPGGPYEYAWPGQYVREHIGRKISAKAHVDPQTREPAVLHTPDGMLWRRAPR